MKDKLETLKSSLPEGVEIVTTYDRSQLIDRAIDNLSGKLLEEFIVVAVVCALFLWHVRSALVAIISLPLGLCIAFYCHALSGTERQYYVAGRYCYCRRGDGRCRYRHDRECA
ncbi:efflux RND transporter permease subunit [Escherichia coli]|nr:efflux RND transporter permease subunit [Escherichia coli]